MSADRNVDAANALRAKVFKILTGDEAGNQYISFLPGGLAQSEYTLSFLKEPDRVEQAHDFATMANAIPIGRGDWVPGTTALWTRYKDWLDRYETPPFSLLKDEQEALEKARKVLKDTIVEYRRYQALYLNAYTRWHALRVLPRSDRPADYTSQLKRALDERNITKQDWVIQGNKDEYDSAYATVQDFSQRDPKMTKQALREQLGDPLSAPNGTYYPTVLTPSDILGLEWPSYAFFHNEINEYKESNSAKWGGGTSIEALLWSASAEHSGSREYNEHNTDLESLKIEFELTRAPIIRPWYSSYLLTSGGWKWPNSTPENPAAGQMISDGATPPSGDLPLVSVEAIFARNLTVTMNMKSERNKESLTQTKTDAIAGWGPFKIQGTVATSDGVKEFTFNETSDGITCAQPQIIAFICQPMPKLPNPNWALWQRQPALVSE